MVSLSDRKMESVKTECSSHVPLNVTKVYLSEKLFSLFDK